MPDPQRIKDALHFAAEHHGSQTVPGTEHTYLVHLAAVAQEAALAAAHHPEIKREELILMAILHDTLEDTGVSGDLLAAKFGPFVATGVKALTKNDQLPKAERMGDSLDRLLLHSKEACMVKLCDRIVNMTEPPAHWSREKCISYRAEALEILHRLGLASSYLSSRLQAMTDKYQARIEGKA